MAELPKYICFKVTSNNKGTEYSLKKVNLNELEETAYWKRCEDEVCYWFECSSCGNGPLYTRYKQELLTDYCPYCGCRMIYESEE